MPPGGFPVQAITFLPLDAELICAEQAAVLPAGNVIIKNPADGEFKVPMVSAALLMDPVVAFVAGFTEFTVMVDPEIAT